MKISEFSCISSVVLSSIIISVICLFRKRYRFTRIADVKTFTVLYMIGFIRLFLPLDFEFTKGVNIDGYFSKVWNKLFLDRFVTLDSISLSIFQVLLMIIGMISCVNIICWIVKYNKDKDIIYTYSKFDDVQLERVYLRLKEYNFKIPKCHILKDKGIFMPTVSGIINRKIILPDVEYSDTTLFYILFHELTHICRKDLYKKLMIELFVKLFWWIPFSHYISEDIEQTMEIQCDLSVTKKLTDLEKAMYMKTIITCMRLSADLKQSFSSSLSFALHENKKYMLERFEIIAKDTIEKRGSKEVLLLSIGICLLIMSYLFVPLPYFHMKETEITIEGEYISIDNSYLIYEDEKYYLVYNDKIISEISKEHMNYMLKRGISVKEDAK